MKRIQFGGPPSTMLGLTLIELITTLAVVAIVLAISLPAYSTLGARNRMNSVANLIVTQLAVARSEAINNHRATVLCPSHDARNCSGGYNWDVGFILYHDANRNRHKEASERVLRYFNPEKPGITVTTTHGRPKLLYHPDGSARGYNATITLCDSNGDIAPRTVILSNSGRVRVSDTTPSGTTPSCPS